MVFSVYDTCVFIINIARKFMDFLHMASAEASGKTHTNYKA